MAIPIPRNKWVKATKVKVLNSGKVQVMVPPSSLKTNPLKRKRNVAAGFYDEDGQFHPIRASYDYSGSRAGDKPKKAKAKAKRKPAAKRKTKAKAKRKR